MPLSRNIAQVGVPGRKRSLHDVNDSISAFRRGASSGPLPTFSPVHTMDSERRTVLHEKRAAIPQKPLIPACYFH